MAVALGAAELRPVGGTGERGKAEQGSEVECAIHFVGAIGLAAAAVIQLPLASRGVRN